MAEASKTEQFNLNNIEKATIFLLSLPEELAMPIFARLDPHEIRRVSDQIQKMDEIGPTHFQLVYEDFQKLARGEIMSLRGGDEYLRKIVGKVKGEDVIEDVFGMKNRTPLTALQKLSSLDPNIVANVLLDESPQTVAVILAQTDASLAAATLELFPHEAQIRILKRMATLESIPRQAMNDIEHVLRRELECIGDIDALDMDGISLTAEVVKHLDFEIGDELLKELEEDNPEAVSRIRRAMFTFEDLTGIDGRGFQTLLKEVTNDQLLMALKGSSDELRDKILGALSKRAAAMIMDDLDILPPQRLSVVEQAQQEIVEIAMRLEAEGKIQVAGHGGEDFV
ncbi:flagellar motor switch protein FliG [Myxococcota bacterium]|nr:flagellar motor switch protein FliG [Myxococcota bacterium]MBU1495742.1 flagellar motor switch protein FliG [Myxococcota bacterium]